MSEHPTIVFLYSPRYVPQQIIDMATAQVPTGFRLELLEQGRAGRAASRKQSPRPTFCSAIRATRPARRLPPPAGSNSSRS